MSHGKMGTQETGCGGVAAGVQDVSVRGELEVTDPTVKSREATVRVHEFKTRFIQKSSRG